MRDRVKVNLSSVMATLERLARVSEQPGGLESGHVVTVPSNYPGDFVDAARVAIEYLNLLPKSHEVRTQFDAVKVNEGYHLLRSGTVSVEYNGKPESDPSTL